MPTREAPRLTVLHLRCWGLYPSCPSKPLHSGYLARATTIYLVDDAFWNWIPGHLLYCNYNMGSLSTKASPDGDLLDHFQYCFAAPLVWKLGLLQLPSSVILFPIFLSHASVVSSVSSLVGPPFSVFPCPSTTISLGITALQILEGFKPRRSTSTWRLRIHSVMLQW